MKITKSDVISFKIPKLNIFILGVVFFDTHSKCLLFISKMKAESCLLIKIISANVKVFTFEVSILLNRQQTECLLPV